MSPVAYLGLWTSCGPGWRLCPPRRWWPWTGSSIRATWRMIIRTAVGAGANGLVAATRGGRLITDEVVRAASGTVFRLPSWPAPTCQAPAAAQGGGVLDLRAGGSGPAQPISVTAWSGLPAGCWWSATRPPACARSVRRTADALVRTSFGWPAGSTRSTWEWLSASRCSRWAVAAPGNHREGRLRLDRTHGPFGAVAGDAGSAVLQNSPPATCWRRRWRRATASCTGRRPARMRERHGPRAARVRRRHRVRRRRHGVAGPRFGGRPASPGVIDPGNAGAVLRLLMGLGALLPQVRSTQFSRLLGATAARRRRWRRSSSSASALRLTAGVCP